MLHGLGVTRLIFDSAGITTPGAQPSAQPSSATGAASCSGVTKEGTDEGRSDVASVIEQHLTEALSLRADGRPADLADTCNALGSLKQKQRRYTRTHRP